MSGQAAALDALRAQIRALEGAPVLRRRLPAGQAEIDALLGGLPRPGLVELCGLPGAGCTRLAAALAASHTQAGRRVAWVDLRGDLYPPGLAQHGVALSRLLLIRPPATGDGLPDWAVEQVLRSGCFALVVVGRAEAAGRAARLRGVGMRWAHAAERGSSTALLLGERADRDLPADVRLGLADGVLTALRDRGAEGGRGLGSVPLPRWPAEADPWLSGAEPWLAASGGLG